MKEAIKKRLEEIVKKLTNEKMGILVTIPNDIKKGDFTSNIAFHLSKQLQKSPIEIAGEFSKEFGKLSGIEYVEPALPGFINFYLSDDMLNKHLEDVIKTPQEIIGLVKAPKYKKAIVEYSSPNIAKPFTVGHLRSTIIGDAVANLLAAVGYEVFRDNHLGDWGTQFGKQIYAIKNIPLKEYPLGSDIEKLNEEEIAKSENPVKDLVALYVKFHEEAEKNPELEDEARKWFKKLEDGDVEARQLWQKCIDWSFKEFDRIYQELGVTFTENGGRGYGESFFEDKMQVVLEALRKKNLLKEDNGAQLVFFPKDMYPPLMIVKADGATLYATRDLAADIFRLDHYGKDVLVVNEVGAEQSLYFKQLYETEYLLGWYKAGQRIHVGHGLYRFKEGKMSTRKGNVIWLEDVLREAERRAGEIAMDQGIKKIDERGSTIKPEHIVGGQSVRDEITKKIAIGALKWNDLKRSSHLDVTFDWDEILSMNGNSGPYVQYAYTRTQSILEKAHSINSGKAGRNVISSLENEKSHGEISHSIRDDSGVLSVDYTASSEEKNLVRKLVQFADVVASAAEHYAPNMVCEYLFELAQLFNNFYQKYRILNAPAEQDKQYRLALTKATGIVLKQGLTLLGIEAPQKM